MMDIQFNILHQNYLPLLISCCSHSAGPQPTGQLLVHYYAVSLLGWGPPSGRQGPGGQHHPVHHLLPHPEVKGGF